jgi:hypothetical protein
MLRGALVARLAAGGLLGVFTVGYVATTLGGLY